MKRVFFLSLFILANLLAIADQSSITFTTTKPIGESLSIQIDAPALVQPNVWIDLNNNSIQDAGEAIANFNSYTNYIIGAQIITIYGDITKLVAATCMLTSIDVSNSPFLEYLSCANNSISTLDVTQNINLKNLECYQNNLTSVDVSHNAALELYYCGINPLTAIDISQNSNLKSFYCWQTSISHLDLSHNPALIEIYAETLNITEVNLANGHNDLITFCYFYDCPNLDCIQIDEGFTPSTSTWFKDVHTNYSTVGCTPVTGVLLNKELTSLNIGDSELLVATISPNNASNPDVSWTTSNSSVATIDTLGNVTAVAEGVANIVVTTAESSFRDTCEVTVNGPSKMTITTTRTAGAIWRLWLNAAEDDKAGVWLDLNNNGIRETGEDPQGYNNHYNYTVSSQTITVYGDVTVFYCWGNDLTTIDVTHNPYLEGLSFATSTISEVDLSHNPLLNLLVAHTSNLYSLDLSSNPLMERLYLTKNSLEYLNLANGNNAGFTTVYLDNNPELECIQIDAGFTPPSWTKDAIANYSSAACPPYGPSYTLEIHKSPLYTIATNRDLKRKVKSSTLDTIRVKPTLSVKEKLIVTTSSFPADNFELVTIVLDENGDEVLLSTTDAGNDSLAFLMPTQKVLLSAKYNVPLSDELLVPDAIPYLELHEGSSLTNQPIVNEIQVDSKIMYKRIFEPNQWYAIAFPYSVSRVTVLDGGVEYELAACSSSQNADGNYYLKCITSAVTHDDVERSWDFETSIAKNKSYIIAFPSTYYSGKEIIFYGDAQTINDASNVFTPTVNTGTTNYTYACNTSFNDQSIQDPYLLSADGTCFIKHAGAYILKPFMSYVYTVTAPSMAPMHLSFEDIVGPKKDPTDLDNSSIGGDFEYFIKGNELFVQSNTNEIVRIVTVDGRFVKSIQLSSNIQESITLERGVYFLQSQHNLIGKIIIL